MGLLPPRPDVGALLLGVGGRRRCRGRAVRVEEMVLLRKAETTLFRSTGISSLNTGGVGEVEQVADRLPLQEARELVGEDLLQVHDRQVRGAVGAVAEAHEGT